MHKAFCAVTDTVSALPASIPQQRHSKGSLLSTTSYIEATYDGVLKAANAMVLPTEGHSLSIDSAHAMLVTEFTAILTALVPRLTQLGHQLNSAAACSIGYAEEDLFWTLWGGLALSSSSMLHVIQESPNLWPQDRQHFHILYPAFQSVLCWLVSMTHSPAWCLMEDRHSLRNRKVELALILGLMSKCLVTLCTSAAYIITKHASILSSTFLPLLCCIASEQLMSSPNLTTHTAAIQGQSPSTRARALRMPFQPLAPPNTLFMYIVLSITELEMHGARVGGSGSRFPLTASAVVHFVKSVLLLPSGHKRGRSHAPVR